MLGRIEGIPPSKGHTDRLLTVGAPEDRSFGGRAIEVGSQDGRMTRSADVRVEVVAEDEQNVGFFRL